jgi:hypothetical protein
MDQLELFTPAQKGSIQGNPGELGEDGEGGHPVARPMLAGQHSNARNGPWFPSGKSNSYESSYCYSY